jgi:hypothetical protein
MASFGLAIVRTYDRSNLGHPIVINFNKKSQTVNATRKNALVSVSTKNFPYNTPPEKDA